MPPDGAASHPRMSEQAISAAQRFEHVESHSQRAKPSLPWQLCSGYAHGRPWAYLGYSEQEQFETTEPEVLNVKLATDPQRLLYPTVVAYHLLTTS